MCPILRVMDPVHTLTSRFLSNTINAFRCPKWSLPSSTSTASFRRILACLHASYITVPSHRPYIDHHRSIAKVYKLTKFYERSHCEPNSFSSSKEFPPPHPNLWNPKLHCRLHLNPLLVPILNNMNAVQNHPYCFFKILIIRFSHLRLGLPRYLFLSVFPTKTLL